MAGKRKATVRWQEVDGTEHSTYFTTGAKTNAGIARAAARAIAGECPKRIHDAVSYNETGVEHRFDQPMRRLWNDMHSTIYSELKRLGVGVDPCMTEVTVEMGVGATYRVVYFRED